MVRADPKCIAIRFAPVAALVLAHCCVIFPSGDGGYYVKVHWPTEDECMKRVYYYGFCPATFASASYTVITHMFVHANGNHLLSNLFSLSSTLLEFGGDSIKDSVEEKSVTTNVRRSWGSALVMLLGGAIGGLSGQLMYNDSKLLKYKVEAQRLKGTTATTGSITEKMNETIFGNVPEPLEAPKGFFANLSHKFRVWKADSKVKIQEKVNKNTYMCGVSAGICALAGFNYSYYERPITAICIVFPEVFALTQELITCVLSAHNQANGASSSRGEGNGGFLYTIMPGQTVGHAAHVGGFVAGFMIGKVCRVLYPREKNVKTAEQI